MRDALNALDGRDGSDTDADRPNHPGRRLRVWVAEHRTEEQVDRMEGIMDWIGYKVLVPLVTLVVAVIVVQVSLKVGWM